MTRTGHYMEPRPFGVIADYHCTILKETRTTYHIQLHPSLVHDGRPIRSVPKAQVIPDPETPR